MACFTLAFWIALTVFAIGPPPADASDVIGSRVQVVTLSFQLENPGGQTLRHARFSIYGPLKLTGAEESVSIEANYPFDTEGDRFGNQILLFQFPEFQAFATKVLTIRANIATIATPRLLEPGLEAGEFLVPERNIEVDAPDIRIAAARLRRPTLLATAREINRWVGEHILDSGYIAEDLGALTALQTRRGDCTEHAYLFAALARANGIPARVLGGFAFEPGRTPRMIEYHNWAEFNIDGAWRVADPQKRVFDAPNDSYIGFRIVSSRVSNSLGDAHRYSASDGLVVSEQR